MALGSGRWRAAGVCGLALSVLALATGSEAVKGTEGPSVPKSMVALVVSGHSDDAPFRWLQCGGVVVGPGLVATAAHCIPESGVDRLEVVPASIDMCAGPYTGERSPVEGIESVDDSSDVALLRVAVQAYSGHALAPVPLESGDRLLVWGWGGIYSGARRQCVARWIELTVVPSADCEAKGMGVAGRACVRPTSGQANGTCTGDSGGPAYKIADDGQATLVGVVSSGVRCDTQAIGAIGLLPGISRP
jgi:hypothetical protein